MEALQWLPTVVIVACEVAALMMIIMRGSGTPRTLGAVGVVALILRSLLAFVFAFATPALESAAPAAFYSTLYTVKSAATTSLDYIGMGLLGAAGILASRRIR